MIQFSEVSSSNLFNQPISGKVASNHRMISTHGRVSNARVSNARTSNLRHTSTVSGKVRHSNMRASNLSQIRQSAIGNLNQARNTSRMARNTSNLGNRVSHQDRNQNKSTVERATSRTFRKDRTLSSATTYSLPSNFVQSPYTSMNSEDRRKMSVICKSNEQTLLMAERVANGKSSYSKLSCSCCQLIVAEAD